MTAAVASTRPNPHSASCGPGREPGKGGTKAGQQGNGGDLADPLRRAEQLLEFAPSVTEGTPANAALAAAAAATARRRRLIGIPEWLAAPSKYQQHWIRYSLLGAAGLWTARFLFRHAAEPLGLGFRQFSGF